MEQCNYGRVCDNIIIVPYAPVWASYVYEHMHDCVQLQIAYKAACMDDLISRSQTTFLLAITIHWIRLRNGILYWTTVLKYSSFHEHFPFLS